MNAIIDLDLVDENDENPFEQIAVYAERALLQGEITKETQESIMNLTLSTERQLQDLAEDQDEKKHVLLIGAMKYAKTISLLTEAEHSKPLISAVHQGMTSLFSVITNNDYSSATEIDKAFGLLSPIEYLKKKSKSKVHIKELAQAVTICSTSFGILHAGSTIIPAVALGLDRMVNVESWDVRLNFKTPSSENHVPLDFIYQFIEILNKIDGVKVILEDIKVGSIKAKLKVLFEQAKSKDEVKELLESSRKFAKAKLEKDYEESEKIKTEKEKIQVEKEILKEQLKQNTSIESDYKRALEIQSLEQDLETKKLQNLKTKMELLKDSRELFSELLAEGYVSQAEFEMFIKGIPFLSYKDGFLTIGESTDVIDEM